MHTYHERSHYRYACINKLDKQRAASKWLDYNVLLDRNHHILFHDDKPHENKPNVKQIDGGDKKW